jgi:hypothetical protein
MNLELTDEQTEALIRELSQIIETIATPSPRIRTLKEIRAKIPAEARTPASAAVAALRAAEQGARYSRRR